MDQSVRNLKQRSCFKCGYAAETAETTCPQCRRRLETATATRVRGVFLVFCGTFLIAIVGYIALWAANALDATSSVGPQFTGTAQEKLLIFALFGCLFIFGCASLLAGLWQLVFGRRNRVFVWCIVGLAILVALAGGAVIVPFDR